MRTVKTDDRERVRLPGTGKGVQFLVEKPSPLVWKLTQLDKTGTGTAKGRVVTGPDGWPVWKGEVKADPVEALLADRHEDVGE